MNTSLRLVGSVLTCLVVVGLSSAADPVDIKVGKDSIDFLVDGKLMARYNKGPKVAKPYFWPVMGPGGVRMTRSWPMEKAPEGGTTDHVHQKSIWFCHGEVHAAGTKADFWSEAPGHGTIVCTEVGKPKVEKNHASVVTKNEWRALGGKKMFEEDRTLHLYTFDDGGKLLVVDITLRATESDVTFGDTKEGSFGVRLNDDLREKKGGTIQNAGGTLTEKKCWGKLSEWCDYSGKLGDQIVGLAVYDDPKNPASAAWHVRGYGLMAANAFGRKSFPGVDNAKELVKIPKGKELKFRYGVLIHKGNAKEGHVAEHYQDFLKSR